MNFADIRTVMERNGGSTTDLGRPENHPGGPFDNNRLTDIASNNGNKNNEIVSNRYQMGGDIRPAGVVPGQRVEDPTAPRNTVTGRKLPADTIPAVLTPGEFVVNAESAQVVGYDFLNKINNIGLDGPQFRRGELPDSKYQQGGLAKKRNRK